MANRILSDKCKQCIYPIAIYGFSIFFDYVGDKHKSYLYLLTFCRPYRQELVCTHVPFLKERIETLKVPPWWQKSHEAKKRTQKWPDKPRAAIYRQIHKYEENAPWCIYALEYDDSIAASSLGPEDINLFEYRDVINKHLFADCTLTNINQAMMHGLQNRIARQVKLYSCVVPYPLIREKCEEVEKGLMEDQKCSNLREKITEFNDNVSAVVAMVDSALMQQRLQFLNWIREFKDIDSPSVKKEIQKNDWFTEYLEEELSTFGFQTTKEFHHNKYCIFGKSRPDFGFF